MNERLEELRVPDKVKQALRTLIERLEDRLGDFQLYLFGSYARGDWVNESDIDVVAVSSKLKEMRPHERAAMIRGLADPSIPHEILAYTPEELEQLLAGNTIIRETSRYWKRLR